MGKRNSTHESENAILNKAKLVELKVCDKISEFLKENFIEDLTFFEKKNKIKIDIVSDNNLTIPEYIIDLKNKSKKTIELIEYFEKIKIQSEKNIYKKVTNIKTRKKTYRKRKFYKKSK